MSAARPAQERSWVAVCLLFILGVSASAQAQDENVNELIREREAQLVQGMHRRDRGLLDGLLADDFSLRGAPDVDRGEWLRMTLGVCWGDRASFDRFRTHTVGDVIVATFSLTFYVNPSTCRPAVISSVITDVWVDRDRRWQLLMRHAAPPPPSSADVVPQYGFMPLPAPIWEVSSELSFVATGGNTSTRTLGMGSDVTHRIRRATLRGSVQYLSSEVDAVPQARSLSLLGRAGYAAGARAQIFGEGTYSRDRFAGILGRTTLTGGVGYTAALPRPHSLVAEGGVGVTHEDRLDDGKRQFATASGATHYRWQFAPGSQFTEDVSVLADLQVGSNWRGASTTSLTVTLSRLLSLKASHALEYQHAPVPGFRPTDMRTSVALVLSLQRRRSLP
jgi:putative salt-induced outer membrane protein YdiY